MRKATGLSVVALSILLTGCQSADSASTRPSASPSPTAIPDRLSISNAPLAATDSGAYLLFQTYGDDRLRAISWDGKRSGIFPARVGFGAVWSSQSPDSSRFVADAVVYDRSGRSLGPLPWPGKAGGEANWSSDGRQLCKAVPERPTAGVPLRLQLAPIGQPARTITQGFGVYGDSASYPVLACDPTRDRAIVAAFGQGIAPVTVWVIRLSDGALIRTLNNPGQWVAASMDGALLARTIPVGNRSRVTIENTDDGTVIKSVDNFSANGFSGDGTLMVGVDGSRATVLLNWRDGKRLWSSTAGPYGGFLAEPGGQRVAIGLGFVGGSDQADVYLVGPDGSSVLLPEQIRAALRY